jgi:hypothetical protein
MPTWVELDYNLGGQIGLLGSQTDTRAQIRKSMPVVGTVGTNLGVHVGSGKDPHKYGSPCRQREQSAQILLCLVCLCAVYTT